MAEGTMREASGLERLEGSVERVIYSNEENGYTICDLSMSEGGEIVTVVGIMPMIGAGDHLCVYGKWTHNPKYGRQFSAEQYERVMPADTASMLRYLASRAIKGIGPKMAQRIIDEFGEDSFDVIENHPEWLASIRGISTLTFNNIGRHVSTLVDLRVASTKSPWLSNCKVGEIYTVPVSHGEGKFLANDAWVQKLIAGGQVATQYADANGKPTMVSPYNPNGSV